MNALIRAAADLQAVCVAQRWKFCFTSGLAVQRWGEPRETVDVDLTVLTGFGDEAGFGWTWKAFSSGSRQQWTGTTCGSISRNSRS